MGGCLEKGMILERKGGGLVSVYPTERLHLGQGLTMVLERKYIRWEAAWDMVVADKEDRTRCMLPVERLPAMDCGTCRVPMRSRANSVAALDRMVVDEMAAEGEAERRVRQESAGAEEGKKNNE
ncbi:hypothetical protein EV426DRAFT_707420 [Tirmania nivea]|nr:hypothetical protein EV426DRAFT_707420 [Tirmania nivea]